MWSPLKEVADAATRGQRAAQVGVDTQRSSFGED
jgi:hypothetical protein